MGNICSKKISENENEGIDDKKGKNNEDKLSSSNNQMGKKESGGGGLDVKENEDNSDSDPDIPHFDS